MKTLPFLNSLVFIVTLASTFELFQFFVIFLSIFCHFFFNLLRMHNSVKTKHTLRYLWNETPGKISMFALRAARFNAVIPLIDKHVTVSSLAKQFAIILRNDDGSLTLLTPGAAAANAKTADKTTNTFILID